MKHKHKTGEVKGFIDRKHSYAMKKKLKELDVITITVTVVNVYAGGKAIEVEVVSDDGMESVLFTVETEGLQYEKHAGEEEISDVEGNYHKGFKRGFENGVSSERARICEELEGKKVKIEPVDTRTAAYEAQIFKQGFNEALVTAQEVVKGK